MRDDEFEIADQVRNDEGMLIIKHKMTKGLKYFWFCNIIVLTKIKQNFAKCEVVKIKKIVMSLTLGRVVGAISLLFMTPLSFPFYAVYILCIATDIADGFLARKAKVTSDFGAFMDSAADLILIAVMLFILIPLLPFEWWMLLLVGIVVFTRLLALGIGFIKYRTLSLLHTYANKGSGLMLAAFPILFGTLGIGTALIIVFAGAFLAAVEELVITITSKKLNRNRTTIFKPS